MRFRNHKEETVYNYLTENGSEEVAILITNFLTSDQTDDLYDTLVRDGYVADLEENDEEDE